MLVFVCFYEFIHSSIIIICGGFATLVAAAAEDDDNAEVGVAINVAEVVGSVVFNSCSSFLSLDVAVVVVVAGNVCAANCHFGAIVGSGTR